MAINLGAMIGSPWMQALAAMLSMRRQNQAQGRYEAAADRQIADALRVAGQIGPETLGTYDDSMLRQLGVLQDMPGRIGQNRTEFLNEFNRRGENLLGGYRDRYNTALGDLKDYGTQEAADIDVNFNNLSQQAGTNFANSSVGTTLQSNIEKQRGAEQRRLGEQLMGLRLNYLPGLSGQTLAAQGGLDASNAAWDAAMRGDILNAQGNIGNFYGNQAVNRSGIVNQGRTAFLNTLAGINLSPPQPNNLPFMAGANAVQPAQPQGSPFSSFLGGVAPGVGQGLGYGFASGWF